MACSTFTVLCSHHLSLVPAHEKKPYPLTVTPYFAPKPPSSPWPPLICFLSLGSPSLHISDERNHMMWPFVSGFSRGILLSRLAPGGCLGAELSVTKLLGRPSLGSRESASSLRLRVPGSCCQSWLPNIKRVWVQAQDKGDGP